jgi:hypothetical protein
MTAPLRGVACFHSSLLFTLTLLEVFLRAFQGSSSFHRRAVVPC